MAGLTLSGESGRVPVRVAQSIKMLSKKKMACTYRSGPSDAPGLRLNYSRALRRPSGQSGPSPLLPGLGPVLRNFVAPHLATELHEVLDFALDEGLKASAAFLHEATQRAEQASDV